MDVIQFSFYLCATGIVVGALNAVLNPNPVYGALGLVVSLFLLGGVYLLIQQEFFAAIQILVYAGAIMVLFLFMLMLLNLKKDLKPFSLNPTILGSTFLVFVFVFKVATVLVAAFPADQIFSLTHNGSPIRVADIGKELFTRYVLPFEVLSLLMLIAIIGAVVLAKKKL